MNYIIFFILIAFSIVFLIFGILILTPRYNKTFREDKLIKSDDKTYAIFELDSEYQEFLNSYKIFKHEDKRFLTLNKNESINYIEYNVVCFKNEKYLQSIRIKDTNIRKNEEYLVNLPTNATSFKVEIKQINDTLFEVDDMKKMSVFKELLASIFFALASIAPITLIEFIVFREFNTTYYDKNRVLEFMFNKLAIDITISIFAVLVFVISFLVLLFKNKRKTFKFISNKKEKEVDKDINEIINFKHEVKKDNYSNNFYYKVKTKFPKDFINGVVTINIFKYDNTLAISFNKFINKNDYKFNIKKENNFDYIKFEVIEANFDKYSYKDKEFHNFEFINKDQTKANKLTTYGVTTSIIVFLCVFALSIGGVLNAYSSLSPFKNPDNYFDYDFLDNDNRDKGIEISDYYSTNKMMITPSTLDGYEVKKIKEEAFKNSRKLYKVGFESDIEIQKSAFESSSLFEVDLNNVKKVGDSAFKGTHLINLTIPSSVTSISSEAFRGIRTLTSLTFEEGTSGLSLQSDSFRFIRVWGNIIIKRNISSFSSATFKNATFNDCYIYSSVSGLTKTNFKDYFNNNSNVYFLTTRSCNHDFNSFHVENGKIDKDFDGEFISTEPGTCVEKEKFHYRCKVCDEEITLFGSIDATNHNYEDGVCTWCGKEEVKD